MKRMKGFTLVELVVTLVVIIILMSVSVPIYKKNYNNFKLAEGYALLAAIRSAQEQYYSEYGRFLSCASGSGGNGGSFLNVTYYTTNEEVLGINALTNKYFTWFCINGQYNCKLIMSGWHSPNSADGFVACVQSPDNALTLEYSLEKGSGIFCS